MIIENRPGAGSNIGTEAVARAEPDGYTILLGSLPLAVNRYLYPSLGYDSLTDLAPLTLICRYPNLLVVPITSPAKSVAEFIAYAKANKARSRSPRPASARRGISPASCSSAWPASR